MLASGSVDLEASCGTATEARRLSQICSPIEIESAVRPLADGNKPEGGGTLTFLEGGVGLREHVQMSFEETQR